MVKRAPARRRPRKAKPGTKGLGPGECRLDEPTGSARIVSEAIEKAGGCVVGSYKEPLGGHPLLLSVLPIGAIEPTPFQRDLSDTHHKRLADVINKTGRLESRPGELHPEPLAEPDVNLSAHPAPIKQTVRSCRYANVRKDHFAPQ